MSVNSLLNQVARSDEELEANLSTMLQSVRGTEMHGERIWFANALPDF